MNESNTPFYPRDKLPDDHEIL